MPESLLINARWPDKADRSSEPAAANENCLLSELQFVCAHTNKSIGTGVWTDNRALALAKAHGCTMQLKCPHCGMVHKLSIDEAILNRTLRWEDRVEWRSVDSLPVIAAGDAASAGRPTAALDRPPRAPAMKRPEPDRLERGAVDCGRLLSARPRRPYP